MKKILLIINPNAGSGLGNSYIPKIKKFFNKKNIKLDIFETKAPKQAIKKAKQCKNKYNIIIAAGGDGTVNEVVNGMVCGKAALGIISLGTANALATEFKIPRDVKEACKFIANKKPKRIDVGKVNSHYFLLCCGVGFDAKVVKDVDLRFKQQTGTLLFHLNVIKNLFTYDMPKLRIIIDGKITNGYTVIVQNSRHYGGRYVLLEQAKIDDGLLDIMVIEKNSPFVVLQAILSGIFLGKLISFDDISIYKGKKIEIRPVDKEAYVHTDAELIGKAPVKIRVLPKKLGVIY